MLTDDLDDVIYNMMGHPETRLSAEGCNTVNFSESSHPCCKVKIKMERIKDVQCAIAGFREQLELRARKEGIIA